MISTASSTTSLTSSSELLSAGAVSPTIMSFTSPMISTASSTTSLTSSTNLDESAAISLPSSIIVLVSSSIFFTSSTVSSTFSIVSFTISRVSLTTSTTSSTTLITSSTATSTTTIVSAGDDATSKASLGRASSSLGRASSSTGRASSSTGRASSSTGSSASSTGNDSSTAGTSSSGLGIIVTNPVSRTNAGVLFVKTVLYAYITVTPKRPTPASSWTVYFFWFLAKTFCQDSLGTPISSMLGLFQFSMAFLLTREELKSLFDSLHAVADPRSTLELVRRDINSVLE